MYKDKKWLYEQFIVRGRSADEIGEECGVTNVTVRWWARKFRFKRRRFGSLKVNEKFFATIDSEEKAYWLGFVAADGSVQNKPGMRWLSVMLAIKDKDHLEKLRQGLDAEHQVVVRSYDNCTVAHLQIGSTRMVADLVRQGIVPNKSLVLKPPVIKEALVKHWIRGYFDGDGCVSISKCGQKIVGFLGTKDVLKFIVEHLPCSKPIKPKKGSKICRVDFASKKDVDSIMCYLYKNAYLFLQRKRDKFYIGV